MANRIFLTGIAQLVPRHLKYQLPKRGAMPTPAPRMAVRSQDLVPRVHLLMEMAAASRDEDQLEQCMAAFTTRSNVWDLMTLKS